MRGKEFGTAFSETATGTQRATATHAGAAGKNYYVTEFSVSADGADKNVAVQLKNGSTTIWQDLIPMATVGTGLGVYSKTFSVPLGGTVGNSLSVTVGTAISTTYANIVGYEL